MKRILLLTSASLLLACGAADQNLDSLEHEIQGLKKKQRIDRKSVRQAIKSINDNGYSSTPERAGGKSQKGERNERKSPETEKGAEVT